jgi:hypothetical protein
MLYNTFPQFKAGLLEAAGFPQATSDAKIDILFQHYNQARRQTSLTLGRLDQTKLLREAKGTSFEGGKGQLLLTPQASGFSPKVPPPAMTFGKTVVPSGVDATKWKTMSPKEQMDTMMGNKWSIWLNDAFILGGIHSHAVFHLVSDIGSLAGDPNAQFPFNVTQRELIGLLTFGYSGSALIKGSEYTCTDTQLADAATFKSYVKEMLSRESRVGRRAP